MPANAWESAPTVNQNAWESAPLVDKPKSVRDLEARPEPGVVQRALNNFLPSAQDFLNSMRPGAGGDNPTNGQQRTMTNPITGKSVQVQDAGAPDPVADLGAMATGAGNLVAHPVESFANDPVGTLAAPAQLLRGGVEAARGPAGAVAGGAGKAAVGEVRPTLENFNLIHPLRSVPAAVDSATNIVAGGAKGLAEFRAAQKAAANAPGRAARLAAKPEITLTPDAPPAPVDAISATQTPSGRKPGGIANQVDLVPGTSPLKTPTLPELHDFARVNKLGPVRGNEATLKKLYSAAMEAEAKRAVAPVAEPPAAAAEAPLDVAGEVVWDPKRGHVYKATGTAQAPQAEVPMSKDIPHEDLISDIESSQGHNYYGIRAVTGPRGAGNKNPGPGSLLRVGDEVPHSYQGADPTAEQLPGTSALDLGLLDKDEISKALHEIQTYAGNGDQVVVLGSNSRSFGEDPGEILMESPTVLKTFRVGSLAKQKPLGMGWDGPIGLREDIPVRPPTIAGTAKVVTKNMTLPEQMAQRARDLRAPITDKLSAALTEAGIDAEALPSILTDVRKAAQLRALAKTLGIDDLPKDLTRTVEELRDKMKGTK